MLGFLLLCVLGGLLLRVLGPAAEPLQEIHAAVVLPPGEQQGPPWVSTRVLGARLLSSCMLLCLGWYNTCVPYACGTSQDRAVWEH